MQNICAQNTQVKAGCIENNGAAIQPGTAQATEVTGNGRMQVVVENRAV